jgi:signal transduction histidine kinase
MALRVSPRGWSIRAKSVILATGYLLALSAVYAAFTLYLLRQETSQAHDRLQQTARIVAAELDAYVASGAQRLQTVMRLPGLAYGLQSIQEARGDGYIPPWTTLHYLFFKSPVFTGGVFLLDRTGKVLWTEPPGLPWLRQSLTDFAPVAQVLQAPRSIISSLLTGDRLLAQPHVVIAVPIQNDSGDLQGVLGGVIDVTMSEFGDIVRAVSTSAGRFVEVVDQDGTIVAGTDPARLFRRAAPFPTSDEAPMLASVTLAGAPWRVVAGQPPSLALASVWQFQRALWGIGIALLLVAGAVAVPLLNGFVRSIKQLTDAAETVARGDLSQPVVVGKRRDELATLAQAFEQMRVELGRSRRTLEQRLEEREELIGLLMRANEELQLAQARLIEAERFAAIGELSAAVAHGIRNPVAGIKAAAQFASLDLPDQHPLRENIDDIIGEANKLEARIKTLLDFAKPFEPHPAPCRVERIVGDAVASLHSQVAAHGIELVVDLDPALPEAELDYAQMEQVLLAVLSNAIEAMPNGGRITITGRVAAGGKHLRLEVIDTGSGISAGQLGSMFKLFFTTKSSGTGLGLAVAKKIVERHAGTIAVESEIGKGARFAIELPLSPPASESVGSAVRATAASGSPPPRST